MKKIIILSLLVLSANIAFTQEHGIITLNDCYKNAVINSPLAKEKLALTNIYQLNDKNSLAAWLPSLDAGANIVYNSNVVDLSSAFESIPIPGISDAIGSMPHDQYKVTIDINQVIYDGGAIKSGRSVNKAALSYDLQSIETGLYSIRDQVNSTYFSLIQLRKQLTLLRSYREIIELQMKSVLSGVENGVLLKTDYDIINSEKVKIGQQIIETEQKISGLFAVMSDLTGIVYDTNTELVLPQLESNDDQTISRPELKSFDLKRNQLDVSKDLLLSTRRPKAFGFATLGYGSPPGNDFFTDSFGPYATLGAGVRWQITDWNRSKRNVNIIDLNKDILTSKEENFEGAIRRALEIKRSEINSINLLLPGDKELITIRKSVSEALALKLKNGSATATEYLIELNAEKQAVLNHEMHLITLSRLQVEYLYISGKEIE